MWSTIIGHKREIGQLKQAILGRNIPHAYLFSGIEGTGKHLVAKAAAKALLCSDLKKDLAPCENCSNCHKFNNLSHPDFLEIKPENMEITIGLIRDVKNRMKFSPSEAKKRVIIIDPAETMNQNAANAALKILEEPPENNHFFLITSAPDRLLPTIISRCQKITFSPLLIDEIEAFLIKGGLSKEDARLNAGMSEGSINMALSLSPEVIDRITGELLHLLSAPSSSELIDLSSRWGAAKDELDQITYIIHHLFHTALIKGAIGDSTKAHTDTSRQIVELLSRKNSPERLIEKCNLINRTHFAIEKTYNKQLMFEQLLFTLASQ